MDELDVWRTAGVLIREYGEEAPIIAAMRVDALTKLGDEKGRATWRRVLNAIDDIRATKLPPGARAH